MKNENQEKRVDFQAAGDRGQFKENDFGEEKLKVKVRKIKIGTYLDLRPA